MRKRIVIYAAVSVVYIFFLGRYLRGTYGVHNLALNGVPHSNTVIISLLLTLFTQCLFCMLLANYSHEAFYHDNLILLIRTKSRIRSFLRVSVRNLLCILGVNLFMFVLSCVLARYFAPRLLLYFAMQTLGLWGLGLLQEIIEIKVSAVVALWGTLVVYMALNFFDAPWLTYIHVIRYQGSIPVTIALETCVIALLIGIGALATRKQEILA